MSNVALIFFFALVYSKILATIYSLIVNKYQNLIALSPLIINYSKKFNPKFIFELLQFITFFCCIYFSEGSINYNHLILIACLSLLAFLDICFYILPDSLTLSLLWIGLILNSLGFGLNISISSAVQAAALGYSSLWVIGKIFKWLQGCEGIGYGDYKLFAALGAWFGTSSLIAIMMYACGIGSIVGFLLMKYKKLSSQTPLPFGLFLAIAGFLQLALPLKIDFWF